MPSRRSLTAGAFAGVLTAGVMVAVPALAHPSTTAPAVTFSRPMILAGGGAEPSIRVPADGKSAAYVSAPTGLGSNFWRITKKHNADGTWTFKQGPVMQPDFGTGGGDSEISVGDLTQEAPPANGCLPIAYSGLHNIDALDNFTTATSTDCGKSFNLANPFATQNTLTDRQWQVFDGAKTNFLIYHLVSTGQIVVSESTDGGQTYVSLGASNANGVIDPALLAASGDTQQIGNVIVNHAEPIKGVTNTLSGEQVHAMYAIFGLADNTGVALQSNVPGSQYNGLDGIYVGKSVDGGVTWTDTKIFSVNPATKRELNMLFPVITADSAGNLYAVWSDTYKIQYSVSTDHGAHWSKPAQVNRDNRGVAASGADKPDPGKTDVFPWIAAGGNGLVDVVWYHGEGGAPKSNQIYRDPGDKNTKWTVAFAQLSHAARLSSGKASPTTLTYSNAITPIIHHGDVCQNGTFCSLVPVSGAPYSSGDRSLLDFFQIAIDKQGRANLAIADNGAAPGQSISAYTVQLTGYSITTGRRLPTLKVKYPKLNCAPDATFTDPSGDATSIVVGAPTPNQPGLDIVRSYVTWLAGSKTLTFHIVVKDISQYPPAGATGVHFDYNFGVGSVGYVIRAVHDEVNGDSASIDSPLGTNVSSDAKIKVDAAHNEYDLILPADALAKITDAKARGPVIGPGVRVTGLTTTSYRSQAGDLYFAADAAGGLCPFVVPKTGSITAATLPSGPGDGGDGYLPAAMTPHVDSTTLANLARSLVFAILVGACAATLAGRRRRTVMS
jgi:hypothetical protein